MTGNWEEQRGRDILYKKKNLVSIKGKIYLKAKT